MLKDTERLTQNVAQILHIAKIQDKNFTPSFIEIDPYNAIKDIIKRNPHYFEDISITLEKPEVGERLNINAELELFEVVIMNIMTNANHYTKSKKPALNIELTKNLGKLEIHFSDNGIGIEKHELKNIFKKMYQIGKTTKGSGLGLFLSSNITKIYKGSLEAESEGLGHGSCFIVRIPLARKNG